MKKINSKKRDKDWKFTLTDWKELPHINSYVGSTFVISQIETKKHNKNSFSYKIYITPIPPTNPLSETYRSIMDVAKANKAKRNSSRKS